MPDRWINPGLIGVPVNWAIVWAIAGFWLLAFHVLMRGYNAMAGNPAPADFSSGPGTAPVTGTNAPAAFAVPGGLASPSGTDGLSAYAGASSGTIWTDGAEGRYAEDGFSPY